MNRKAVAKRRLDDRERSDAAVGNPRYQIVRRPAERLELRATDLEQPFGSACHCPCSGWGVVRGLIQSAWAHHRGRECLGSPELRCRGAELIALVIRGQSLIP